MVQFGCNLSCDSDLWNARDSRLNGKSREAVVTNGKLERLLLSVHSAYRRLCERGTIFTSTDIKELFQGSMTINGANVVMSTGESIAPHTRVERETRRNNR